MYESPIQMIVDKMQTQMIQQEEDQLLMQVQKSLGYDIDKDELLRALNYDRDQYQKGYKDGLNQYNQATSIDCISREDAIRIASGYCHFSNIPEELKKLPSVNPQPKTGHWIDDTSLGYHVSICSNCNWRGHGDTCLIYKPKYCPNCGCRMVEPQESE